MKIHVIVGRLRQRPSGEPVVGARVRAYDRDASSNDLIGEAVTEADGRFTIGAADAAFAEFVEHSPDVVLEIELPKGRSHTTRRDLRWTAGTLLPVAAIELPVGPSEAPRESSRGSGS